MLLWRRAMLKQSGLCLVILLGWVTFQVDACRGEIVTLKLQSRKPTPEGRFQLIVKPAQWDLKKTAIIVCDMWDSHHCLNAVLREKELAPRMNVLLTKARAGGTLIIHAPSSCMETYANHPARKR